MDKNQAWSGTKKGLLWLLRPGFSKNAASLSSEAVFQQRLFKRLAERMDLAVKIEQKLSDEKEELIKQTEGLSDEDAFEVWVDKFQHSEWTLDIAKRTLNRRRYIYYSFLPFAAYAVYVSMVFGGFFAALSGVIAFTLGILGVFLGMKESWRYYQIKKRSLFPFIDMWEAPQQFLI